MSDFQNNAGNFDLQTLPILKNACRILKGCKVKAMARSHKLMAGPSNHTLWGWAWKAEE
jgi:hypothetical protein